MEDRKCFMQIMLGETKARKFLTNNTKRGTRATNFEVWRKLHVAVLNQGSSRQAREAKAKSWLVCDQYAPLLQKAMFEVGGVKKI